MTENPNEAPEKGSFVENVDSKEKEKPLTSKDSTEPLFKKLDRIATAVEAQTTNFSSANIAITAAKEAVKELDKDVKEFTAALNSLLTTFLMKGEKPIQPLERPMPEPSPMPGTLPIQPLPSAPQKTGVFEKTKALFPDDIVGLLSFEYNEGFIVIKPRQFLGSDNFSKIASIVRSAGGEYVSAGKASHFKMKK